MTHLIYPGQPVSSLLLGPNSMRLRLCPVSKKQLKYKYNQCLYLSQGSYGYSGAAITSV